MHRCNNSRTSFDLDCITDASHSEQRHMHRHETSHNHPILVPAPSTSRQTKSRPSIFRRQSLSIAVRLETSGDWRWHQQRRYLSSGPSVGSNCAKWCRLPTAPSMRWSSAENFRGASRCPRAASSGISRKSKPGWPRADQPPSRARNLPMSGNGDRARFDRRVRLKQRHRRRDEYRNALLARDPGVDDVRPLLHHMAALHFIFRLVVNAA